MGAAPHCGQRPHKPRKIVTGQPGMIRSALGSAKGGGQRSNSGSSAGGLFMAVLVTAILLSSTEFLSTNAKQPEAGCWQCVQVGESLIRCSSETRFFIVHNAVSDAYESFRRDFFACD